MKKYIYITLILVSILSCAPVYYDDGTDVVTQIKESEKQNQTITIKFDDGTDFYMVTNKNIEVTIAKKHKASKTDVKTGKSSAVKTKTTSKRPVKVATDKKLATKKWVKKNKEPTLKKEVKTYKVDGSKELTLYYPVKTVSIIKGFKVSGSDKNSGLDFAVSDNTDLYATAPGVVIFSGKKGSLGNTVIIYHNKGLLSIYYNLKTIKVNKGDYIKSKNSMVGSASGTFHYELRKQSGGKNVVLNPKERLKKRD